MRFQGKVALVTGAGSGIGRACAAGLAAEGAFVGLLDRNSEAVDEAVSAIGEQALPLAADVTAPDSIQAALEALLAKQDRLDVLINCAGIEAMGSVTELSVGDWERCLATNLSSVFHMARAVLPVMLRQGRGAIVNVASQFGVVGAPAMAAYCAAKGGVVALTKAMALDYAARGVRVNAICPGPVATPMLSRMMGGAVRTEGGRQSIMAMRDVPIGRMAKPEEIASMALYLASDEASFVTGAACNIDGGWTAR